MIESTSKLLATQSVDIQKQAASATVSIDSLKAAFANIYQSMDAIDTFKVQALDAMSQTITVAARPRSTSRRSTSSVCVPSEARTRRRRARRPRPRRPAHDSDRR